MTGAPARIGINAIFLEPGMGGLEAYVRQVVPRKVAAVFLIDGQQRQLRRCPVPQPDRQARSRQKKRERGTPGSCTEHNHRTRVDRHQGSQQTSGNSYGRTASGWLGKTRSEKPCWPDRWVGRWTEYR